MEEKINALTAQEYASEDEFAERMRLEGFDEKTIRRSMQMLPYSKGRDKA